MGWGTNVNQSGTGVVWSSDCSHDTDSEGVRLTCIQEVRELIKCIDSLLGLRVHGSYIGQADKGSIQVYESQRYEGRSVIKKLGGNWIRLTNDELWSLRNELLRRTGPFR